MDATINMFPGPPGFEHQQHQQQLSPTSAERALASTVMGAAITTVHKAEAALRAIILIVRVVGGDAAALQVEHCASMLGSLGKTREAGAPAARVLVARTTAAAEEPAARPLEKPAARPLGSFARCIDCKVNLPEPSGFHLAALAAGDHQPRKRCSECRAERDKARDERDKARAERAERDKVRDGAPDLDPAGAGLGGSPATRSATFQGVTSVSAASLGKASAASLGKGGRGRKAAPSERPPAPAPIRSGTFAPVAPRTCRADS